ncbi:hypothetical protein [Planctomyces sp. SH-PL14]|uniref:hypothetical protein n=1 Tax=Planctomyces sp. SH-PL14 TaxID=1632864 RepID=UPI0018D44BD9|nr:hypothetical protein [Planctomyces sp. SH-PL14]
MVRAQALPVHRADVLGLWEVCRVLVDADPQCEAASCLQWKGQERISQQAVSIRLIVCGGF